MIEPRKTFSLFAAIRSQDVETKNESSAVRVHSENLQEISSTAL